MAIGSAKSFPLMGYDELFDQSYERVKVINKNNKSFFDTFYDNFIASSELIRDYFRGTDMDHQKKMLEKSFYSLFIFYATNNANDYLNKIAERHSKQGANIPAELYDLWMDALIKTVKEYDPQFNDDIELAWRVVLASGITYMKYKYDN